MTIYDVSIDISILASFLLSVECWYTKSWEIVGSKRKLSTLHMIKGYYLIFRWCCRNLARNEIDTLLPGVFDSLTALTELYVHPRRLWHFLNLHSSFEETYRMISNLWYQLSKKKLTFVEPYLSMLRPNQLENSSWDACHDAGYNIYI